jgi:hypothetical protein
MFNLTKGEGFGRPLLEFSLSKKPIIVSGWSGHIDFLQRDMSCLLGGQVKQVHPSAQVKDMILGESGWFNPDINQAKHYLRDVYEKYDKYVELARKQSHYSRTNFSFEQMKNVLAKHIDAVPKQVQIQLPKLNKVELPKLNKV